MNNYSNMTVIFFSLVISGYGIYFIKDIYYNNEIDRSGTLTSGEIINVDNRNYKIKYYALDDTFKIRKPKAYIDIEIGERYYLSYDINDPKKIVVHFSRPIIDSLNFQKVLLEDYEEYFNGDIKIYYKLNDKEYNKIVRVNHKTSINRSQSNYVYVNIKNPKSAFLEL